MARRISALFIDSLFLLFVLCIPLQAQNTGTDKNAVQAEEVPLFNGITVSADLLGLGSKALGGDFLSSEIGVEANLKNRFFPVLEIGYGTTDAWNDNGTNYKSSAPYFRLGLNYNTMYKKGSESYLYVGLRYAMSSFKYDINTLPLYDPLWGTTGKIPVIRDDVWGGVIRYEGYNDLKGNMHWLEFLVGVQAHITGRLYMGWTLRMKSKLSASESIHGSPWYVPGFGTYASSKIGITYSIIYKLPFWQ